MSPAPYSPALVKLLKGPLYAEDKIGRAHV